MSREQAAALAGSGKLSELWKRIGFVLGAFIVYRIGSYIPVPGVNPVAIQDIFNQTSGTILDVLNMFSGGALQRMSVMSLSVMPYISASIIMSMLTVVEPRLKQIKSEGEAGRRKIQKWTRYAAAVLATAQGFGVASMIQSQPNATIITGPTFIVVCVLALVAGTMFLVWLSEQITDRGIGNGLSLIIFAGIVAGLPSAVAGVFEKASTGEYTGLGVIALLAVVILVTAFVVFVERGQRRLTVSYANQQRGNKMMQAPQTNYFPLKMNMAGVIPPIFASSIILFPASLVGFFGSEASTGFAASVRNVATLLQPGELVYTILYIVMIVFFAFFYTALVFEPKEIAENLKKQNAFLPGIRPGQQTAQYIDHVVSKLTLVGAGYLAIVCLIPEILNVRYNVPFYFGGTSLLIIVIVVMDLMSQFQSYIMSQQYESLMKKSNLTGGGKPASAKRRRRRR